MPKTFCPHFFGGLLRPATRMIIPSGCGERGLQNFCRIGPTAEECPHILVPCSPLSSTLRYSRQVGGEAAPGFFFWGGRESLLLFFFLGGRRASKVVDALGIPNILCRERFLPPPNSFPSPLQNWTSVLLSPPSFPPFCVASFPNSSVLSIFARKKTGKGCLGPFPISPCQYSLFHNKTLCEWFSFYMF